MKPTSTQPHHYPARSTLLAGMAILLAFTTACTPASPASPTPAPPSATPLPTDNPTTTFTPTATATLTLTPTPSATPTPTETAIPTPEPWENPAYWDGAFGNTRINYGFDYGDVGVSIPNSQAEETVRTMIDWENRPQIDYDNPAQLEAFGNAVLSRIQAGESLDQFTIHAAGLGVSSDLGGHFTFTVEYDGRWIPAAIAFDGDILIRAYVIDNHGQPVVLILGPTEDFSYFIKSYIFTSSTWPDDGSFMIVSQDEAAMQAVHAQIRALVDGQLLEDLVIADPSLECDG